MTFRALRRFFILCITAYFTSCASTKQIGLKQPAANISSLKYLSTWQIPNSFNFNNTTVGGLSGIDYDASNKRYYFISDDRSDINPARFYTASIFITQKGIDSVVFTDVHKLVQANGKFYPNLKEDAYKTPDL